jgi:hypothetical protein
MQLQLAWILGKQSGMVWTGFIWLRIGTKHYKELSGYVKDRKFLD